MHWSSLTRRLKILETARPTKEPNALASDEWQRIRRILLKESEPYPEAKEAIEQAIFTLERGGEASDQLIQETLGSAMWPFVDARVAIAEALVKADHPD